MRMPLGTSGRAMSARYIDCKECGGFHHHSAGHEYGATYPAELLIRDNDIIVPGNAPIVWYLAYKAERQRLLNVGPHVGPGEVGDD